MKIIDSMKRIEDIEAYLGFKDEKNRTTISWCKENNVPLFQVGKAIYANLQMFEAAIERIIVKDCNDAGLNGKAIAEAISKDDKIAIAELTDAPITKDVKKAFNKSKKENDFEKFTSKIKTA